MGLKHDTKSALQPIEGVVVCANHQSTIDGIYGEIKSCGGRAMSKAQTVWCLGILSAVAVGYGGVLWAQTSNANAAVIAANAENSKNIIEIDRRVLTLELRWQQVQAQLDRIEMDAKTLRTETNAHLEGIRRLVQEAKKP